MLDRKEEHLDTGNRPSATAHIRAGVTADGMLTAFDAQSWGTGGAGAGAASRCHTSTTFPNRKRVAHRRLHQRRPAARDARARTSAGLLPDRNPDGRARRSREDGSGRVPREEPAAGDAPNAMWAEYFARGAKAFGWDKRHADRRSDAGSDQDRHGRVSAPLGRRGPRIAGARRHHVGRQRRREVRHAGHRHRHADDRRDRGGRNAWPAGQRDEAGDRRLDATRSAADPAAARRPRRSTPAIRVDVGARRSTRCSRRSRRRSASTPENLVAEGGRIHVKGNVVRRACRGRTRAS